MVRRGKNWNTDQTLDSVPREDPNGEPARRQRKEKLEPISDPWVKSWISRNALLEPRLSISDWKMKGIDLRMRSKSTNVVPQYC